MTAVEDDWLLLSTLQHFAYCPRQAALLREGVWTDNHLTVEGNVGHARVDAGGVDHRRGVRVHHRVDLVCHKLRLRGVADAVEELPNGILMPVEHKRGRGAGDLYPTVVQAVAQALCLEEMTGREVRTVAVLVTSERRRELFVVEDRRSDVERLIEAARSALSDDRQIPAEYDSRRCRSCSVQNACQPRGVQWR